VACQYFPDLFRNVKPSGKAASISARCLLLQTEHVRGIQVFRLAIHKLSFSLQG
jgi:hypothetical protein